MFGKLKIDANTDDVTRLLRTIPDKYAIPAAHQAINTTLRNSRVEFSKRVRKRVAVKSRTVKDAMRERKATRDTLEAEISWKFEPLSLKSFGSVRQGRKGTSVTVMKGQRTLLKGAFVSESMGGHVFSRSGEKRRPTKGRYANKTKRDGSPLLRQPTNKLFGPSMQSQAKVILPGMRGFVVERMAENTRQAANRFIDRARRQGVRR